MRVEEGHPLFVDVDGEPVFAVLHEPAAGLRSTAVLFIPPFGWEESCSYRSRRTWATSLAEEGFAVLRFDLPGTGDSAAVPTDADRVGAWLRAITSLAAELRSLTGCSRVAGIGLGLGGLLAYVAACADADLDELVLWAVPGRGRSIVRELKAFAQLEATRQASAAPIPEGALTINGFLMSAETAAAISAIDVRSRSPVRVRRALLLHRDRIPVDEVLRRALVDGGTDVSVAGGRGYSTFMAEPQLSEPPWEVISTVSDWLASGLAIDRLPRPERELNTVVVVPGGCATPGADGAAGGGTGACVRERLMTFELPEGPAFGVLSEPLSETVPLCAVLLNAGGIRRTGPNRMWVETARRWASRGVPTLRLDLVSLGDAGGPDCYPLPDAQVYEPRYGHQIRSVFDALSEAGLPQRIFLVGLCSGAYWSFQVGQVDERVAGVVMLNPMSLVYDPFQWTVRRSRFVGRILKPGTLRRVLHGAVPMADLLLVARAVVRRGVATPSRLLARIAARRKALKAGGDRLDHELDRLRDNGPQALLAFSPEEPLYDELVRDGHFRRLARWPNIDLRLLDGPPSAHMMQPLVLQEQARALMDSALESLLTAVVHQ